MRIAVVAGAAAAVASFGVGGQLAHAMRRSAARPSQAHLDPQRFAELARGIVLVRAFNCRGTWTGEGTGFLIGSRVVMTAAHVVNGACSTKVRTRSGAWVAVDRRTSWSDSKSTAAAVDLATLRLHTSADGHDFAIRTWSPRIGTRVAALGHPLGDSGVSVTQGIVAWKGRIAASPGVPMLGLRMLGAQGSSGSPIVDDGGNVVGILQIGLGGQETSGRILAIDLPSWWPHAREQLCRAYPVGGTPNCKSTGAPTEPPPPPPSSPPPTSASSGYYAGNLSDSGSIGFNVGPNGKAVSDLHVTFVRVRCSPHGALYRTDILGLRGAIDAKRNFNISTGGHAMITLPVGDKRAPARYSLYLTGSFSGTSASGTVDVAYDFQSINLSCSSNLTWKAETG
jgi:Trypsin-like peptidase domain